MSTTVDLDADPAAVADVLREATERGASLLAGGDRAAGPATPQDSPSDLVPSPDAVGLTAVLGDGLTVVVMLVPELAEELTGQREAAGLLDGLAAVVEEIASGLGLPVAAPRAVPGPADLDAALGVPELLMGSGIFAGDAVVATVALGVAAGGFGSAGAAGPPADPSIDPASAPAPASAAPVPGPAADGTYDHAGAPSSAPAAASPGAAPVAPGTAVPPRGSVASRAPLPGEPVPAPIEDASLVRGLQILAEVNLEVTAELGRAALRVSELLDLQPGAIIELDRDAGAPVELFVNGTLFARAEVVVVDGSYAVRICELLGGGAAR